MLDTSLRMSTGALLVALTSACGGGGPAAEAPTPAASAAAVTVPVVPEGAPALTGQQVVELVCSVCHSMDSPPLTAPPLTHIARHLREAFSDEDEAVRHMLAYLPAPDQERSVMPPMAVERFGLMPPQPLPPEMIEAAARYIWGLAAEGGV